MSPRQVALARQRVQEARIYEALRAAKTAESLIAAADKAREEGNARMASRLYVRLLRGRGTPREYVQTTREALANMGTDARERLEEIQAVLGALSEQLSQAEQREETSGKSQLATLAELLEDPPPTSSEESSPQDVRKEFLAAVDALEALAWDYGHVPEVNKELKARLAYMRRNPRYVALRNEPRATAFWQLGSQHEQRDELCCAYGAYEKAAKLLPAPTARQAAQRLGVMREQNEGIEQSTRRCRQLRTCHQIFSRAERLAKVPNRLDRAARLYEEVLAKAPSDSPIHASALKELNKIEANR